MFDVASGTTYPRYMLRQLVHAEMRAFHDVSALAFGLVSNCPHAVALVGFVADDGFKSPPGRRARRMDGSSPE